MLGTDRHQTGSGFPTLIKQPLCSWSRGGTRQSIKLARPRAGSVLRAQCANQRRSSSFPESDTGRRRAGEPDSTAPSHPSTPVRKSRAVSHRVTQSARTPRARWGSGVECTPDRTHCPCRWPMRTRHGKPGGGAPAPARHRVTIAAKRLRWQPASAVAEQDRPRLQWWFGLFRHYGRGARLW
jgi:hypothetical protein